MFCPFSREKKWHKLRKVQLDIRQLATVRSINHKEKRAELTDVNIKTGAQSILILRGLHADWGGLEWLTLQERYWKSQF